ncbi:hypothetical protein [Burkholderia plantarii]|uniref:hypothetical protein n=1 Tax=Burkholderia plantarii TaxID=41899 RepID=UPI0007067F62|nr:hypothetical protein [Burkholderia plantarii]ALK32837.1 hypothetical protein bpln_2g05750 [Burkholderia plantarii]
MNPYHHLLKSSPIKLSDGFELNSPLPFETAHQLSDARVVWIDRDAVRRDFGDYVFEGNCVRSMSDAQMDDWFLRKSAYISNSQLIPNSVNTEIPVGGNVCRVWRPKTYGRAGLIEISSETDLDDIKFFDVKGHGVAQGVVAEPFIHRSGLLPLVQALYDVLVQRIMEKKCRLSDVEIYGATLYGVIDAGFRGVFESPNSSFTPCGLTVRAANLRPEFFSKSREVEKLEWENISILTGCILQQMGIFAGPQCRLQKADGKLAHPLDILGPVSELTSNIGNSIEGYVSYFNVQLTCTSKVSPFRVEIVDFGHFYFGERQDSIFLKYKLDASKGALCGTVLDLSEFIVDGIENSLKTLSSMRVLDKSVAEFLGFSEQSRMQTEPRAFSAELAFQSMQGRLSTTDVDYEIKNFVDRYV